MNDLQLIAIVVKRRRAALQLTQQDLSELSGVALRTINSLERGKAAINLKNLLSVADALGLEINLDIKTVQKDIHAGM